LRPAGRHRSAVGAHVGSQRVSRMGVHQKGTAFDCGDRLDRFEPFDPRSCCVEEFFQCSPVRDDSHE
jgi:hypothetical protein